MVSNTNDITLNLAKVSHTRERIWTEIFRKQDFGEIIWTQEGGINRRMEKTAQ
jgi:hypothetical protein